MVKLQMTISQKRKKPTSIEIERGRAKECYKALMDNGHMTKFQLRESIGGISASSFYQLTKGIFKEKPFNGIIRWEPMTKKWYTPQKEHYDGVRDTWVQKGEKKK
jgi:hypothetical protein